MTMNFYEIMRNYITQCCANTEQIQLTIINVFIKISIHIDFG